MDSESPCHTYRHLCVCVCEGHKTRKVIVRGRKDLNEGVHGVMGHIMRKKERSNLRMKGT